MLALTWGMPGILTMESDRGAFELLEFATVRPYPQVLFAVFLFFMLPPLLLGALRNWWDRDGHARAALAWPLRAPAFWLPGVLWCVGWIAVSFVLHDNDGLELVAMAVSMLVFFATPFFCLNPSTLDDTAPARWWRPGWPGMRALAMCLAFWAGSSLISFVVGELTAIGSTSWMTALLSVLDELLSACFLVIAIAAWLNRGHWRAIRSDLLSIWRNGFVGEYVWQSAAIAVVFIALAFPILVSAIQAIFVIPQYEHWASATGAELPTGLRLLRDAYRADGTLLFVFVVPLELYFTLVQGRLMRQHGVGKGLITK
ncbi:hypothetical protein CSC73_14365 [Pseudoxanthomonas sacheonensis]|nr:hypothetical protein CSC73_14365 [Pseudoxanthomonas sacheonensis]